MFDKILIANRGEIACRVVRTARRMGVKTVAAYSDADAEALHVRMADEAWRLGPPPAAESYLNIERIVEVCKRSGAQAAHPGYGFLSENAAFARRLEAEDIVFIGPPAGAIEIMGSKAQSKRVMERAGVPLAPGYHGGDQDDAVLTREAARIGYPVLVKPSAGGGGKGMRAVEAHRDLPAALAAARREAMAAFGDDALLIEKYLDSPRHVEAQIFADSHGNCVHLFDRDCSLQRRHQKVIEEAPAPGLPDKARARLAAAAVAAAKAVDYRGAGTVEFLYQDGGFFFIEMNARLQVEHPVTEMITGQDLVEWQLRVAAGEPLPRRQKDLRAQGHAFEARIYAEDPQKDFLPCVGRLTRLRPPADGAGVRIDTGVVEGDAVSAHYDPMIAKLIVWDRDRPTALRRLRAALEEYRVAGVTTNIGFLTMAAAHPAFADMAVSTGFIDRHRDALIPQPGPADDTTLAFAALDTILRRNEEAAARAAAGADPWSPWNAVSGWRLNDDNRHDLRFGDGETETTVTVRYRPWGYALDLPGGPVAARAQRDGAGDVVATLDGARRRACVVRLGADLVIEAQGRRRHLRLVDPGAASSDEGAAAGGLSAPMPGKISRILVAEGEAVVRGQALVALEAMKMEHTILAPADGRVVSVVFAVGDQVEDGAELLVLEAADG